MLKQKLSPPVLTKTEWLAVTVAIRDVVSTSCTFPKAQGWLARNLAWLFGTDAVVEASSPPADARTEALRRFICTIQRQREVDEDLVAPLLGQGFTRAQVDAIAMVTA